MCGRGRTPTLNFKNVRSTKSSKDLTLETHAMDFFGDWDSLQLQLAKKKS